MRYLRGSCFSSPFGAGSGLTSGFGVSDGLGAGFTSGFGVSEGLVSGFTSGSGVGVGSNFLYLRYPSRYPSLAP